MPSEVAPLRIGIFGGYGTGNFGNDASFEALRDFLRAEFPNADISAICSKPEPTAKRFGVKAVGIAAPRPEGLWRKLDTLMLRQPSTWRNWARTLKLLNDYDVILSGGTGVFDDFRDTPLGWPSVLLRWCLAARIKGERRHCVAIIGDGAIYEPEIMAAFLDEANKLGLGSTTHIAQLGVARANVLQAARLGLRSMEHWYGLPEALFDGRTVQDFPLDYNYNDESHRFGQAGRLWKQAAPPGSKKWNDVMDELIKLKFTIDPTFTIYEASRDLTRAMRAEWHDRYTLPSLWKFYQPSREAHGSYWFYWTTQDEIEWKNNYRLWMAFVNEFKNRGGRVTTGSDSGFIYKLYGFDYIRELELLQEAGFHPLEVIRSATLNGAQLLHEVKGEQPKFGAVRPGMLADLIIVPENPVANLKVLYGTGALKLNDQTNQVERVGGIKYTIKDGIVYDAKKLLADVEKMVETAKKKSGTAGN